MGGTQPGAGGLADLVHAEAMLAAAEARVLRDASPDNLRRLGYWRERVRVLREASGAPPASAPRTGA